MRIIPVGWFSAEMAPTTKSCRRFHAVKYKSILYPCASLRSLTAKDPPGITGGRLTQPKIGTPDAFVPRSPDSAAE